MGVTPRDFLVLYGLMTRIDVSSILSHKQMLGVWGCHKESREHVAEQSKGDNMTFDFGKIHISLKHGSIFMG